MPRTIYDATHYGHKSVVGFLTGIIVSAVVASIGVIIAGVGSTTLTAGNELFAAGLAIGAGTAASFVCAMIAEPDSSKV